MTHHEDERHLNLLLAIINQAIMDAKGTARQYITRKDEHSARVWLVQELPYVMALVIPMDKEDINRMQKELSLWVRCGCPQDGSWFERGGKQLGLWI